MPDPRRYQIMDDYGHPTVISWTDLAAVNDPETMDEIAMIEVGESTILGMCDPIKRLPDVDPHIMLIQRYPDLADLVPLAQTSPAAAMRLESLAATAANPGALDVRYPLGIRATRRALRAAEVR